MGEALEAIKLDGYKLGNYQAIIYDRARVDLFPQGYVSTIYNLCKNSGRRTQFGILPNLFCGMSDLSHDAITTYLIQRKLIVLVRWDTEHTFTEAGIAFPVVLNGKPPEQNVFAGYGYFGDFWGHPDCEILGMLGLAYLFEEFQAKAIHGIRYEGNFLTAKFTRKYGFRDTGSIPRYMLKNGSLVSGIVSSLLIEDFEAYAENKILAMQDLGKL